MKKIDCRKMNCPQPVINTKQALDQISQGIVVSLVDNETAKENILLFAKNNGYITEVIPIANDYQITITKGASEEPEKKFNSIEASENVTGLVYLITSNFLGQGSPDLGEVLMSSMLVSINELNPAPRAILFINTGIMLTCHDSRNMDILKSLAGKGTEMISCGTCLDYYKLRENLKIGRIGNMLEINNLLVEADKVIGIP
ncbi:MAG: sulfurtransferase-like selenium metabolism protein YedF [Peptococcaceae bacterium]|nr:sulfurtransferase-like selenium metabolism protein YedF [Peptococcaceae bacterium]